MIEATDKLAYRPKSFAIAADLSLSFVKKEIRDGNLKSRKVGGARVILAEDARDYLQKREEARDQDDVSQAAA